MTTVSKKLKRGDKLAFTDDEWKSLEAIIEDIKNAEQGLETFAKLKRKKHNLLWKTIRGMKPEADAFHCQLLKKGKIIVLLEKK